MSYLLIFLGFFAVGNCHFSPATTDHNEKSSELLPSIMPDTTVLPPPTNGSTEFDIKVDRATMAVCNRGVSMTGSSASNPVIVQSPNFPYAYPNNVRCSYYILVPANTKAYFKFTHFQLQCPYDSLKIGYNNAASFWNFCFTTVRSFSIEKQTFSYYVRFDFYTDSRRSYSGFRLLAYGDQASSNPPSGSCSCGRFNNRIEDTDRIIGGFIARTHQFPYQVLFMAKSPRQAWCGGTVISPNYVLSAAHCFSGFSYNQFEAVLGEGNYQVSGEGETVIQIRNVKIHPNYNRAYPVDADFALVQLASRAPVSNIVGIACLPPSVTDSFAGTSLVTSGWGRTVGNDPNSGSPQLKGAFLTGVDQRTCSSVWNGQPFENDNRRIMITDYMICATGERTASTTCRGDSGGPLVANVNGKATLVGVTSFGNCGNYNSVFSRVTSAKSWILSNSDAGNCQN